MSKKKKGYTLIELIIVLGILTITFSIVLMNISSMRNTIYKITLDESVSEVRSILSLGKTYCRKNGVNGMIVIYDNKLAFVVKERGYEINKSTEGKTGLEINSNFSQGYSGIDKDGYIKSAGRIVVKIGKSYVEIKIGVGNDIIGVSEVDIIE